MPGTTTTSENKRTVPLKNAVVVLALSAAYLLLSYLLVGFKQDQLLLVALVNGLYFLSPLTRKLVTGFSVFILYWVLYDYMKAFPNYLLNPVHIADLYAAEKALFGIQTGGELLTPNEFWLRHSHPVLDVASALFYLGWVPVPLAFAVYLFFKSRRQFVYFSLTFLLVNLIGFVIYYLYPAAPPWYVQTTGFDLEPATPGNPAGLARFDTYFQIPLFSSLYAKGSNVFAAMPSLHAAYPLIVLYYSVKNRLGPMNWVFGIIMIGIWFAAIYTSHHYVLDVLAGILCGVIGICLFDRMIAARGSFYRAVNKFIAAIR